MRVTVEEKRTMTAEDLYSGDVPEKFVELIGGELNRMTPSGWRHGKISYAIARLFDLFCAENRAFDFIGDNVGFLIQRDPDTVLSPDAALFRRRSESSDPWYEFAPEIVVEILSPSNNAAEMLFKRKSYFDAGTEQFWQVDPDKKKIEFFHSDGRVVTVTGDETVDGEGIAKGMKISLAEVFRR